MIGVSKPGSEFKRIPLLVSFEEQVRSSRKDVYGSLGARVAVTAQLLRGDEPSDTIFVTIHQIGSQAYLPVFSGLAAAGFHVLAAANRYISGDFPLQIENVILDLAACVRYAKEKLGYKRVILVGWSGGGSVISGYQAEAEDKRVTANAAGEYSPLADTDLIPADGVVLAAPHRSRHKLLADFIDPAIVDENDPYNRDPDLDLYPLTGERELPLDRAWLSRYREAQVARSARITAWVKEQMAILAERGDPSGERAFVVHGTMADPRWVDITIDPNERAKGSYIGDPRTANDSLSALGRCTSLRGWLSQWSLETAQFDAVDAVGRIKAPLLLIVNDADDACPTTHTDAIWEAMDKTSGSKHHIAGANHYYLGKDQRSQLAEAVQTITDWHASLCQQA